MPIRISHMAIWAWFGLLSCGVTAGEVPNAGVERIRLLGNACLQYMSENNGNRPPSVSTLYYEGYVGQITVFAHPENTAGAVRERVEIDDKADYVLSHMQSDPGFRVSSAVSAGTEPLIQERTSAYNNGQGIYVFYTDGSVRFHSTSGAGGVATPPAAPTREETVSERMPESASEQRTSSGVAEEGAVREMREATPQCNDLSGAWTQQSHGVPCPSTFHLTKRENGTYDMREEGCGFARGTARKVGNALRIDWKVNDYCEGYYIWPLNDDCSGTQGKGTLVFTHPTDDPRSCNKGTHETIGTRR